MNTDTGEGTQYDTFSKLDGMSLEGYKEFKKCCIERGVVFSSTPFNLSDVDILEEIGMDVYKISSSDITYLQLIDYISRSGKPIIISTGCASLSEIEKAVDTVHKTGNNQVILQHCILQYPCDYKNANLNKMIKIQEVFSDIPVGYSDHTIGTDVPCAAIAMGAKTIEKHFTIDKKLPNSPDHKLSANPEELARLVESRNRIEEAKGIFISGPYPAEEKAFQYARKSLVASANILAGTKISSSMLTCKRPGTGIYPEYFDWVDGLIAKVDILEDTTITKEMIS